MKCIKSAASASWFHRSRTGTRFGCFRQSYYKCTVQCGVTPGTL